MGTGEFTPTRTMKKTIIIVRVSLHTIIKNSHYYMRHGMDHHIDMMTFKSHVKSIEKSMGKISMIIIDSHLFTEPGSLQTANKD